jgi:hypothetical protein
MELPTAVRMGESVVFMEPGQRADFYADQVGGRPVSLPPDEYEQFAMRRLFWRELGKDPEEMTEREVAQALMFMNLEHEHPQRFNPKKESKNGS